MALDGQPRKGRCRTGIAKPILVASRTIRGLDAVTETDIDQEARATRVKRWCAFVRVGMRACVIGYARVSSLYD
jgi:hypothetical protein